MKKLTNLFIAGTMFAFTACGGEGSVDISDACACEEVFAGQSLKVAMGGVAGGDMYNKCRGKYTHSTNARKACVKYKNRKK